uniref:Thyrotropin-releasing hormone receptor n=1 Tax=Rhodnius prolixus TaxID=13249 RepID=T1HAE5_RHOPR
MNATPCECFNLTTLWTDCDDVFDNFKEPEYFSYRYRTVGTLFQGIVFIVGVLGNAMVVLVVSKVMALHSPTNYYLVSLAIADTVVLLASVPQEVLSYYLVGNQWIWGNVGCSLMIYCQNLGINASSLSLVTLTVERYIAICHPMKAHKICTIGRAKKITVGMWVFAIFYCSPWLFLTETVPVNYRGYPEIHQCIFKRPREEYLVGFFLDLVLFYVIPLILSCILYTLIIRSLNERGKVTVKGAPKGSVALEAVNTHSKSQAH